jgi:uridine kinase
MSTKSRPFVLGLTGGAGVGKSTLADGLLRHFGGRARLHKFDAYFLPEEEAPEVRGTKVWDHPEAWNHQRFADDLQQLISDQDTDLIIVDSFLLLAYPHVRELVDHTIYLDAPFEVHAARKIHVYPDRYPPGLYRELHERYVLSTRQQADYVIDVSDRDASQVLQQVQEELAGMIES